MARVAKKVDTAPPSSARRQKPSHGPGSITDEQMRCFQDFLEKCIVTFCTDKGGKRWAQRRIAERLGITQNEVGRWQSGKARPGLPRLILLREKTGASIEHMLGLERSWSPR